jgi:hypothetical protein
VAQRLAEAASHCKPSLRIVFIRWSALALFLFIALDVQAAMKPMKGGGVFACFDHICGRGARRPMELTEATGHCGCFDPPFLSARGAAPDGTDRGHRLSLCAWGVLPSLVLERKAILTA